jgi:hypothetical protein
LLEKYRAAITDPELLALREDIALLDIRLGELIGRVDAGESGATWQALGEKLAEFEKCQARGDVAGMGAALGGIRELVVRGVADHLAWQEIGEMLERRRKLTESERRRLVEMRQVITVERLMVLLNALVNVIRENVLRYSDRQTATRILAAISTDIGKLMVAGDSGEIRPGQPEGGVAG